MSLQATSLTQLLDAYLESGDVTLFVGAPSAARVLRSDLAAASDEALVACVAGDPALAASVLRDANAPRFDALQPVGSLEEALRRLGRQRVEALVGRIAHECVFPRDEGLLRAALESTWRHACAVGHVARLVARRTGHPELAAASALLGPLSDVGVLFLIAVLVDQDARPTRPLAFTDAARFDVLDHLQHAYGLRLLQSWGLPASVLAALAGEVGGAAERKQSLFLRLARHVVASIGLPPAGRGPSDAVEGELWEIAEELELSQVDIAALQVHAEDAVAALDRP